MVFLLFQSKNDMTKWHGWHHVRIQSWTSNCGTKLPGSVLPGQRHFILNRCRLKMHELNMKSEPCRKLNQISRHVKGALGFWHPGFSKLRWVPREGYSGRLQCAVPLMRWGTRKVSFHEHHRILPQHKEKTCQKVYTFRWAFLHETTLVWCWLTWSGDKKALTHIPTQKWITQ